VRHPNFVAIVAIISLQSPNVTDNIHIGYISETPMARLPTIEFTNWRDPKGYRILEATPPEHPRRIVRNGKGETKWVPSNPLAKTRDLFLIFARTSRTPEGVLRFVQQYGPLTHFGNDPGDIIDYVISHAANMAELIDSISTHRRMPPLQGDVAPGSTFYAAVVWDPITETHRWEFRPSTLLDGLWLQFGEAVTRGAEIGVCAHCGGWFEAGRGAERRAGAKFCSEDHKIAHHSLKRSRET
jgi:hypothetical protein